MIPRAALEPRIVCCADAYDAAEGADAVAIVTEWDVYRALDLDRLARVLSGRVLVDLRNIYGRADVEGAGFTYIAIGR